MFLHWLAVCVGLDIDQCRIISRADVSYLAHKELPCLLIDRDLE